MAATHYGLNAGQWEAGPDFTARRGADGTWEGSQTFRMPLGTWETAGSTAFVRGATINSLFPELDSYWSFLQVESVEVLTTEGGIVEVRVDLTGFNSTEYESDRDVTYSLSGVLVDRDIMLHPLFITEITNEETIGAVVEQKPFLIGAITDKTWARDPTVTPSSSEIHVYEVATYGGRKEILDNGTVMNWWNLIVDGGMRTYLAPTLEWVKETTNAAGLTGSDLEDLGKAVLVEDVDGSPPTPFHGHFQWMKVSADESRSSGAVSTTEVWRMSPPGGYHWIYNFDLFDIDKTDNVS